MTNTECVYVTGGTQRRGARGDQEWFSYAEAAVCRVDLSSGAVEKAVTYVSPGEVRPEDPRSNIVFKSGVIDGDVLHVCTQTEILAYDLPDFTLGHRVTHPWFNDLHHVGLDSDGNYLVAVTGLDLALRMTRDGTVLEEWPVHEQDTWDRFDRDTDYRRVLTTKPHHAHPNFIFEADGEVWVTRLHQKDAVCVTSADRRIDVGVQKVHDGHVRDGKVWFTTVDGRVAVGDLASGRMERIWDLNDINGEDRSLGWCRGLHLLDGNRVLVGFSRLRPTRIKENLTWVKHKLGLNKVAGSLPTRIALYDLDNMEMEREFRLEEAGLNAVFAILPG